MGVLSRYHYGKRPEDHNEKQLPLLLLFLEPINSYANACFG